MKWLLPLPKLPCRNAALLCWVSTALLTSLSAWSKAEKNLLGDDVVAQRCCRVANAFGQSQDEVALCGRARG